MTRFITALSLTAGLAAIAGCGSDESRDHTSPMYSSGAGASNLTQTCAYNYGPRAGQTVDYSGTAGSPAVQVGIKCADMHGSSGWAVAPQPGAQPPARGSGGQYYTSPGAPNAGSPSGLQPGFSLFCRFNRGPAAGHTADYSSTLGALPSAIGSSCSDGPNSGVVVGPGNNPAQ